MGNLFSFARDALDDNLIVTNQSGVDVLVWVNGGGPAATVKSGTVTSTCVRPRSTPHLRTCYVLLIYAALCHRPSEAHESAEQANVHCHALCSRRRQYARLG